MLDHEMEATYWKWQTENTQHRQTQIIEKHNKSNYHAIPKTST